MKRREFTFVSAALFSVLFLCAGTARSAVLHVPGDYPTIQAAVDAAAPGDTVLVDPGVYMENISFKGKAILVKSAAGAAQTVIDGGRKDSVVSFASGEGPGSVLEGFTLTNGLGKAEEWVWAAYGAGVYCKDASPVIRKNLVTIQVDDSYPVAFRFYGLGIYVQGGAPLIEGNLFYDNEATTPYKVMVYGAGIYCTDGAAR